MTDFPSIENARNYVVETAYKNDEKHLRHFVSSKMPPKFRNQCWRPGFRVDKMSEPIFKEGLKVAIHKDKILCIYLLDRVLNATQMSPIQTAFFWWPVNESGIISEDAYNWLSVRFQPIVELLVWYQADFLEKDNIFKDKLIVETEEQLSILCISKQNNNYKLILDFFLNNLPETALEFTIPRKKLDNNILASIHSRDYISAADNLVKSKDYRNRIIAATCLFNAKEFDSINTILKEVKFSSRELMVAQTSAFDALIALDNLDYNKCFSKINKVQHVDQELFNWPTWSILKGLAYHLSNQHDKAALAFLYKGGGDRGYSLLPLLLAFATLESGGLDAPDILKESIQQKYATPDDRLRAEKELQFLYGKLPEFIPKKTSPTKISAKPTSPKPTLVIPQSFNDVEDVLREQFCIKNQVQQNLADGNYEQLASNSQKLNEIVQKQKDVFTSLVSDVEEYNPNAELPLPAEEHFGSEKLLDSYLKKLKKYIEDAGLELERIIEQRKKDFVNKLTQAGIEVPKKIEKLASIPELEIVEKEYEARIEIEGIYQDCIKNGLKSSNIAKLHSSQRLNVYQRLADNKNNDRIISELFEAVIQEKDLLSKSKTEGLELLLRLTEDCLRFCRVLPSGVWKTLKQLNNGKLAILLEERKLLRQLEQCELVNISEFFSVYDGNLKKLPYNLKLEIEILALAKEKPSNRIPKLTSLFLTYPNKTKIAETLLVALLENNQYEESLCLASLGANMGWLQLDDETLRDLLVMVMLLEPAADKRQQKRAILEVILSDLSWVARRLNDVAALLYILSAYNLDHIYVNLKYQYPDEIKTAEHTYPELIGHFLDKLEKKSSSINESMICRGVSALNSFEHDLEKQSCYKSWEPAVKYQRYFNKILSNSLDQLQKSKRLDDIDAISVIEEAQKNENIPPPDAKRQVKMQQYIEKQIQRLKIIFEALSGTEFKILKNFQLNCCEAIRKESNTASDNDIMRLIYHNVLGGQF